MYFFPNEFRSKFQLISFACLIFDSRKGFADFTVLHGVRVDGPPPWVPQEWWPPDLPGRDAFAWWRCHVAESGMQVINALIVELLNVLFTNLATWLTEPLLHWNVVMLFGRMPIGVLKILRTLWWIHEVHDQTFSHFQRCGCLRWYKDPRCFGWFWAQDWLLVVFKDRENHRSYSEHANNLLVPRSKRAAVGGWMEPQLELLENRADFTNADWWQLCQAKMVVFKFINCYCSLYYIAFLKEKGFHWNVCKRRELEARFFLFKTLMLFRITGSPGSISPSWYISCIIYGCSCTCLNDFVNITSLCAWMCFQMNLPEFTELLGLLDTSPSPGA